MIEKANLSHKLKEKRKEINTLFTIEKVMDYERSS